MMGLLLFLAVVCGSFSSTSLVSSLGGSQEQNAAQPWPKTRYCGWAKSISHHFETMRHHCLLVFIVFTRESSFMLFFRWCELDFVHPQYGRWAVRAKFEASQSDLPAACLFSFKPYRSKWRLEHTMRNVALVQKGTTGLFLRCTIFLVGLVRLDCLLVCFFAVGFLLRWPCSAWALEVASSTPDAK